MPDAKPEQLSSHPAEVPKTRKGLPRRALLKSALYSAAGTAAGLFILDHVDITVGLQNGPVNPSGSAKPFSALTKLPEQPATQPDPYKILTPAPKIPEQTPLQNKNQGPALETSKTPNVARVLTATSTPETRSKSGLEIIGTNDPLTQVKLENYVKQVNSKEIVFDNKTYYGSFFMSAENYKQFPEQNDGEGFESFLARHEASFNNMFKNVNNDSRIKFKSLVIMDRGAIGYAFQNGIKTKDIDGIWIFENDYYPKKSAYYHPDERIDNGFFHELGHRDLFLLDPYKMDFSSKEQMPQNLFYLTPAWREYMASHRQDISRDDFMCEVGNKISLFTDLQLKKRLAAGNVHRPEFVIETWRWNNEIPLVSSLDFGGRFVNADVNLYRTHGDASNKILSQVGKFRASGSGVLEIPKADLFHPTEDDVRFVKDSEATLLFELKSQSSVRGIRWMDIRDFNIAYWKGFRDFAKLGLNVAAITDDPKKFDYTVKYNGRT